MALTNFVPHSFNIYIYRDTLCVNTCEQQAKPYLVETQKLLKTIHLFDFLGT